MAASSFGFPKKVNRAGRLSFKNLRSFALGSWAMGVG
jgi:hypothetical protein